MSNTIPVEMCNVQIGPQSVELLTSGMALDDYAAGLCSYAAHVCTGTEDTIEQLAADDQTTQWPFLEKLLDSKHMSIFEHYSVTVELVTSRAISHQIVRHRLAAYSQQSQRYVKYNTPRNKQHYAVIEPVNWAYWSQEARDQWTAAMIDACENYELLLKAGLKAEEARDALPNAMRTKLIATWNLRQLLHILYDPNCGRLANKHAQAQVRDLFRKLEHELEVCSEFMSFLLNAYKQKNKIETI